MDIQNRDNYYNSIYKAYIINDKISDDPESNGRYQIYIPQIHYSLEKISEEYVKESDKSKSKYFGLFPWAVSLVKDLSNGDAVYGSFIKNSNNSFIILGKNAEQSGEGGTNDSFLTDLTTIVDLAMPIIVENEVGIDRNKWPDGLTDNQFKSFTADDNGKWSIGVIQWHGCRAFDILYEIAKADTNWESYWPDKSIDLYQQLKKAVKNNDTSARNNWEKVVDDTGIMLSTQKMLGSEIGKKTQIEFAKSNTKDCLNKLVNDFNLTNPAIMIWLLDIMNQYGSGVNNSSKYPHLKGCINEAAKYEKKTDLSMIDQLKDYKDNYWFKKTSLYEPRRTRTFNYIVQLDKDGKLTVLTYADLTALQKLKYIPELGEYFWPVPSTDYISCFWGEKNKALTYSFTYNSPKTTQGYSSGAAHNGLDIAGNSGCEVIAVGSGTVVWVNGGGVSHSGSLPKNWNKDVDGPSQGNCIGIKMDKNKEHNFVYMHLKNPPKLKVGDKVTAGDVVGYMGSTGRSTGTHLHIGLHLDKGDQIWKDSSLSVRIDPLPYFGKKANDPGLAKKQASSVSSTSGDEADQIIEYAKTFLGNEYKWGGKTPPKFDCSGLTHYVFKHFGYEIGEGTDAQRKKGIDVAKKDLQKADLVHFHDSSHVGIYIGDGKFIHSPKTGDVVKISKLSESYYTKHWLKGTRVLGYVKKSK